VQLAEYKDRVDTFSEKLLSVSKMKISVRVRGEWLQVPCRNGKSEIIKVKSQIDNMKTVEMCALI
jgi:hypothetical protein